MASQASFSSLLTAQFDTPGPHPQLNIIRHLKSAYPQSQHLSILDSNANARFPLPDYLGSIDVRPTIVESETHSLMHYVEDWETETMVLYANEIAGVFEFTYDGTEFRVFKTTWTINHQPFSLYHIVFPGADDSVGQNLVKAVFAWSNELKEEMWVFEGGRWTKDKELYAAVQGSSWDDVVLEEEFKDGLRRDTQTFFASKVVYESVGVTWKRGILLLGPPGNGKTESIKALLRETKGVAPLYVKSFTTCSGPEAGIRDIFDHARRHSPCILILEDLDSMLQEEYRSFFLNELDGLAQNSGILTVASTNHPERIDDAILNRPSRFDVKYNFALPNPGLRVAFAQKWLGKVNAVGAADGLGVDNVDEVAAVIAEKTEGWSFAFLKELFVSFLLRLAHDRSLQQAGAEVARAPAQEVLLKQVDQLASQIIKRKEDPPAKVEEGAVQA